MIEADASGPASNFVNPLLTDMYQITMAYAYFNDGRQNDPSVFDMFFRKNPFKGEYTIFAGLEEAIRHISSFKFTKDQIDYIREQLPHAEEGFFEYLAGLNCDAVKVYAIPEGSVVFPRTPVMRIEGPLGVCQLLETTLLNACNFASLIATNARRMRQAADAQAGLPRRQGEVEPQTKRKSLLEFGLRRAQGPDGAMSASRYAYIGGFDGTSNVLAGKEYSIPISGTHAHSFVTSYTDFSDLKTTELDGVDLVKRAQHYQRELGYGATNASELAAFIAYAIAFPKRFLALVDTYDTLNSGVPNFICVALSLKELGYQPLGIRLDSGDLAYLSKEARVFFSEWLTSGSEPISPSARLSPATTSTKLCFTR